MSDYVIKNGRKVRACKYTCQTMVAWDEKNNYFVEVDNNNIHHTQERCKEIKTKQPKQDTSNKLTVSPKEAVTIATKQENHNNNNDISLELVLKKLKSIGVTIDLDVLRNAVNGNTK